MTDKRKDDAERRKEELGKKGQYGGLEKGLGYGGGRDVKDADRPARDIDHDADKER